MRGQAASIVACDSSTVESVFLRRYYALFFIAHDSRRVVLAGCTTNPTGAWLTQQARNLALDFSEQGIRFLIRDRDSKYSRLGRSETSLLQRPIPGRTSGAPPWPR